MGMDLIGLKASKKYTEETVLGGGAVVGKNVTISSIVPIDGGNRVTFSYTLDNGTVKTSTMDVMNGKERVYTGTTEPTSEYATVWINPEGVVSPIEAKVEQIGNEAKITVTDYNGSTSAVVKSKDGVTPNLTIGTVETLASGSEATASITGTVENPVLNLGIPKGADGNGSGTSESTVDVLDGKKILFVGDSICYGTGLSNGQYPYPYWIGQLHPTATIINDGVAGSTICYQEQSAGDSISLKCQNDRYSESEFADADIVVIEGGINDLMRNKTFGTLKSGYMNIRQKYYKDDITTYAGALEYIFKYFTEKFVGKRILFTTIHRLTSAIAIDKQWAYWECASEACAKWGVEFIDLFHSIPTELTGSDLHPNNATHRDWYAKIIDDVLVGNRAFAVSTNKTYYGKFVTTMSALITTGYTTNVFKVGDTFSQSDWRINSGGFNGASGANVTSKVTWDLSDIPMDSNKVLTTQGTYYAHGWANIDGVFMDCAVPVTVNEADSEGGGEEGTTAELTGIGASKSKTTYTVGETLNTDDITVTGTYSDGSTKDLTSEASIDTSGVNMDADGVYVINVSVDGGYTATISITVKAASSDNVDAIFVYEADGTQEEAVACTGDFTFDAVSIAAKQQYTVSYDVEVITENFDCSALQGQRWRVVTPYNYEASIDGTTPYWGWDNIVSNTGALNPQAWIQSGSGTAKTKFSKTYTAGANCSLSSWNPRGKLDVGCSGKVTIKISNFKVSPTLSGITATKTKTEYTVNNTLNIDDITVTANYSDGSSSVVSEWTSNVSDVDMASEGTKTLTISYTENEITKTASINITISAATPEPEPSPVVPQTGTWQLKTTTGKKYIILGTDDDNSGNAKFFRLLRTYNFPYTMNVEAENILKNMGSDVDTEIFTDNDAPALFSEAINVVTLGKYLHDNNLGEVSQHGDSGNGNCLWNSNRLTGDFLTNLHTTYTEAGGTKTEEELKAAIMEKLSYSDCAQDAPYVANSRAALEEAYGFPICTSGAWGDSYSLTIDNIELDINTIRRPSDYDWRGHNYLSAATILGNFNDNTSPYDISRMSGNPENLERYVEIINKIQADKVCEFFWHMPFNDQPDISKWRALFDYIKGLVDEGKAEVITRRQYAELGEYVENPITKIMISRDNIIVGSTDTDEAYNVTVVFEDGTTSVANSDVIIDRSLVDTETIGSYTVYAYYRGFKTSYNVPVVSFYTVPQELKNTEYWFVYRNNTSGNWYCGNITSSFVTAQKNWKNLLEFEATTGTINGWKSTDNGSTWEQVTTNVSAYQYIPTNDTRGFDFNSEAGNSIDFIETSGNFEITYSY